MSEPLRDDTAPGDDTPPFGAGDAPQVDSPPVDSGDGPGLPPPTAMESLVNALLESGPEVAEHVVNAAKELLLAAQTIVEAAEKAVQEQQELRNRAAADETAGPEDEPAPVRHLDVAE